MDVMEDEPQTVGDVLRIKDNLTELDAVLDVSVDITAVLGTAVTVSYTHLTLPTKA